MSAAAQTHEASAGTDAGGVAVRAMWLGARPWWLDDPAARAVLGDIEAGPPEQAGTAKLVVHARADALDALRDVTFDRLVADLSGVERLGRASARVARSADTIVVDDPRRLGLLGRRSSATWALIRAPIDLAVWVPEQSLPVRDVKRFRRTHRLGEHILLYAGPCMPEGGLHLVLEAARALRDRYPDLVVAAVGQGAVDARYRDRCERSALALGHRGIVDWSVPEADLRLWHAVATVVCAPGTAPVDVATVSRAAATGTAVLARAVEPSAERSAVLAPLLQAPGDATILAARLAALLDRPEELRRAGARARRAAESELSPAGAATRLRRLWTDLAAWPADLR